MGLPTTTSLITAGGAFALGLVALPLKDLVMSKLFPGGKMSSINKATSGAQFEKELPQGNHPLQLYSLATPNGQKVTIALEEMNLKYDAHMINIMKKDQFGSGFVALNPNSKIPTMLDKQGPNGKPVRLFESVAIMLHLAEKTGKFIPKDPAKKLEMMNWLIFQVGEAPYFGQFGHFTRYAPTKIPYAINRYTTEVQRALDVLDKQLEGREYICDEYTIADMAWYPWVVCLTAFYKARETLDVDSYKNVCAWEKRMASRPGVQKGVTINSQKMPNYSSD